jgi:aryl-phospho-beta-D-glucosidase BglC (GH1 family)
LTKKNPFPFNFKAEDGHSFLYNNTLGGTWVAIPFNDTAKAQGDQPTLEEKWDYSANRILGVNLGGWLVLEPFIVPSLFEPYVDATTPAVDEWTLCQALGTKAASVIENHYKTFITEKDFADIASAGLNWVRLPVGWWMIETWDNEPFVAGVSFKYFLKAITWARKYGLRINLDLHAVPGSQNGWNHSGKLGTIGFLHGSMGVANAQRALNYVRTLTQFISQSQYKNVVPMFSVLNEAQTNVIGANAMRSW